MIDNENVNEIYKCKYCQRIFKRQCDLTKHINVKHLGITKVSNYSFKTKKKCNNCNKYISIANFNKHYKSCINEKRRIRDKDTLELISKCIIHNDKYICPICNKEYSKMGIGTHIWRMHTESGIKFKNHCNDGYKNGTRVTWNKGLTKYTDERVKRIGEINSKNAKLGLNNYNNARRFCATKSKYGWYKNIYCDSSWELAFLIYCLDNNKNIIREERSFEYIINKKKHKYYPDFLVDGIYYEIKGRNDNPEITNIKLNAVKKAGFSIIFIDNISIQKYIKYVKSRYNINKIELLYDKMKPTNAFNFSGYSSVG